MYGIIYDQNKKLRKHTEIIFYDIKILFIFLLMKIFFIYIYYIKNLF